MNNVCNNDDILMNHLPGNVYCKNTKGIIFWHNVKVIQELQQKIGINSLIGKTINDVFSPRSAQKCHNHDLEILNGPPNNINIKIEELILINSEIQNYFTITKPLINNKNETIGIMVNTLNIKHLNQTLKKIHTDNN